jgi:hypothetical protein
VRSVERGKNGDTVCGVVARMCAGHEERMQLPTPGACENVMVVRLFVTGPSDLGSRQNAQRALPSTWQRSLNRNPLDLIERDFVAFRALLADLPNHEGPT